MSAIDEKVLQKLRETFVVEAEEHLRNISAGLLELERLDRPEEQQPVVEKIFRETHSLKGAARTVGEDDVEALSQALENVLAALRRQQIALSPVLFDLLHYTVDTLQKLLFDVENAPTSLDLLQLIRELDETAQSTTFISSSSSPETEGGQSSPDPSSMPFSETHASEPSPAPAAAPFTDPAAPNEPLTEEEEAFLKEMREAFRTDGEERLQTLSENLLALETETDPRQQSERIEALYREVHSVKGAAGSVQLTGIVEVCQALEDVLSRMKQGQQSPSPPVIETLNQVLNLLRKQIAAADRSEEAPPQEEIRRTLQRLKALEIPTTGEVAPSAPPPPTGPNGASGVAASSPPSTTPPEQRKAKPAGQKVAGGSPASGRKASGRTIRVSAEKLDAILFQSEEMLAARLNAEQRTAELQELLLQIELWRKEWDRVRSQVHRLRQKRVSGKRSGEEPQNHHWRKLGDFLEHNEVFLNHIHQRLRELTRSGRSDLHTLRGMVDRLLEDTQKILMLPFSTLTQIFPRLVRDISRSLGKEVELVIRGSEVEMDKRILEELKDPLIHLLRNCLDHGLEAPEVRQQRGKPPRGVITVAISQLDGGKVELLISDDGNGIDVEQVKRAAIRAGTLTEQEAAEMEDREALRLIFRSQVSTSPMITELSGRGLGMSIVQEKVEALGGSISVETEPGAYTRFRIILPLTLARFRGVLVEVAGQIFVVPSSHVERVLRISPSQVKTVENRETITVNGRVLPVVPLARVLELPLHQVDTPEAYRPVLVLTSGSTAIAFAVDRILNEQEVLVKSLGKQLLRVRNIGGATVLGSGKVVVILNPLDVLRSAMALSKSGEALSSPEMEQPRKKRLLVAEDSITTRTLLKHILETAGYEVETAVDGAEALARLKQEHFDALVSDIEMPRMDGFELTAQIRREARLSELPVVLVTSRGSPEDRERGVEVGANAYIIKSDFDQSNLLQVIERLL